MKRLVFTFIIPLAIVGGAVAGASVLVKSAESAEAKPPEAEPLLVEVVRVESATRNAQIAGNGRVEAARQLTISPQLSGRLVDVAPELVVGARVKEGQILARIDARDYQSALARERNSVAAAQRDLEVERGRARASEREWELLGAGKEADPDAAALVRREPQREAAQANLAAAKAAVRKAQADVSRTVLKAPFDATVLSEQVEEGQFVSMGAQLATLMATGEVWIRVAVPVESLAWIDVPGLGSEEGATVAITQPLGNSRAPTWEGRVLRLVSELEDETRRAQLIVAVQNPLDVARGEIPLLPGSFVDAVITGRSQSDVVRVPREAVFAGNSAWIVDDSNRMHRRELEVLWSDRDAVYVGEGLANGDRVVLGEPKMAIEDMEVRVREAKVPAPTGEDGSKQDAAESPAEAPVAAAKEGEAAPADDEGGDDGLADGSAAEANR